MGKGHWRFATERLTIAFALDGRACRFPRYLADFHSESVSRWADTPFIPAVELKSFKTGLLVPVQCLLFTLYEFEICFKNLIITSMITPYIKYINEVAVNLIILGQVIRICADRFWRVGESNDKVWIVPLWSWSGWAVGSTWECLILNSPTAVLNIHQWQSWLN